MDRAHFATSTKSGTGATFLVALLRVAGLGLTYFLHVVTAKSLGVEQYGVFSYALNLCLILVYPLSLGFVNGATRFVPEYLATSKYAALHAYIRALLLIPVGNILVLAPISVAVLYSGRLPSQASGPLLGAILICAVLCTLSNGMLEVIRGFGRAPTAYFYNNALWPGLALVITLLTAQVFQLQAVSAVLIAAGSYGLVLVCQLATVGGLKKSIPRAAAAVSFSGWLPVTLPIMKYSMSLAVMNVLDVIMIGVLLTATDIGVYSAVQRLVLLLAFAPNTLYAMAIPTVAYQYYSGDVASAQDTLRRATFWAGLSSATIWLSILLFGESLLDIFGPGYSSGYKALVMLAAAYAIRYAIGPNDILLATLGRERLVAAIAVVALALGTLGCLLAIPAWGIEGAAIAAGGMTIGFHLCLWACARRFLQIESCAFLPRSLHAVSAQR